MSIAIDLTKKIELSLEKAGVVNVPVLEVRLAVDESGSMQDEYRDGLVDAIIDRFIVAAMKFDDNQSLDVAFFSSNLRPAPNANIKDVGTYIKNKFPNRNWGGTNYAPVVSHFGNLYTSASKPGIFKSLFGGSKPSSEAGIVKKTGYCAVITDGDNSDRKQFEDIISRTNGDTYFEFIAIGTDITPGYLGGIAKTYKHVGFTHIKSPKTISDQDFYDALINPKFVEWFGA